jgi:uncharacterized protein (DUF433 family)
MFDVFSDEEAPSQSRPFMVSVVLDNLAAGEPIEEIMRGYGLHQDDINASLAYAAKLARERIIPLVPGDD